MRPDEQRRYPILLTLVAQSAVDVLDECPQLFDHAVSGRESVAKTKLTEVLAQRARDGEDRRSLLDDMLAIVCDSGVADADVGALLRGGYWSGSDAGGVGNTAGATSA